MNLLFLKEMTYVLTSNRNPNLGIIQVITQATKPKMIELTAKNRKKIRKILYGGPGLIVDLGLDKIAKDMLSMRSSYYVVEGGILKLIDDWKRFVIECENGYSGMIEEYRNELDGRFLIQTIVDDVGDNNLVESIEREIKSFDERFRSLLTDTDKCIWGKPGEKKFNRIKHFWYFGILKNAKGDLLQGAKDEGFLV